MTTYIDRDGQRDYIRSRGVPIGENALKDLAGRKTGPKEVCINGRQLSTKEWLDEWIDLQAQHSVQRRGRRNGSPPDSITDLDELMRVAARMGMRITIHPENAEPILLARVSGGKRVRSFRDWAKLRQFLNKRSTR